MSKAANIVFIWKKSVYRNDFRCPDCGAALFNAATNAPTDDLIFSSPPPASADCYCGRCGAHVASAKPNTGGFAPGLRGQYPGSVPREKVMLKMYGVGIATDEAYEWMSKREEEFLRIVKEAKIKAVHTDPAGHFQAFLFLHPKQRDKAYEVLRRHFKTAFVIVNPVIADITEKTGGGV